MNIKQDLAILSARAAVPFGIAPGKEKLSVDEVELMLKMNGITATPDAISLINAVYGLGYGNGMKTANYDNRRAGCI